MRAVILAAGCGGRLRGIVGDRPKGLAVVGDCSLIERQVRTLRECGIAQIAIVTGFHAPEIRRVCDPDVDTVHNASFASTNSLYSLWLARGLLADGFLVLNCDVLFHPQLLADLLTSRYDDALLMCPRSNGPEYSDEEMKVCVRRGLVTAIDKALPLVHADGENVGIAKFGAAGAALLVDEMTAIVRSGGLLEWLPRAFAAFSSRRPLHAIETRGYPWIEIDFPEDYWLACNHVLPAIEADVRRAETIAAPPSAIAVVPGEPCHV
jgi:L-glutamine-phosphate cytidylyltransferase